MEELIVIVKRDDETGVFVASDQVTGRFGFADTVEDAIRLYADQLEDFRAELDVPDDELGPEMRRVKYELRELYKGR